MPLLHKNRRSLWVLLENASDSRRFTPVKSCLICFTWLQEGFLKPVLKKQLQGSRPEPTSTGIVTAVSSIIQRQRGLTLTTWFKQVKGEMFQNVMKLTAAMVEATHSTFTNTAKKRSECEHESIVWKSTSRDFSKINQRFPLFNLLWGRVHGRKSVRTQISLKNKSTLLVCVFLHASWTRQKTVHPN